MTKLKLLDLFSGIGGFSYAAHMTEKIETVAFCEIEPFARKVLAKNYPNVNNYLDITEMIRSNKDAVEFINKHGRPDIICGGFPCQPFSIARAVDTRAKGTEDHRDLWPHMLRVIRGLKPRYVVGENVSNFSNMELDRSISDLEGEGYTVRTFILPAYGISAPHKRERCWIIATNTECQGLEGYDRTEGDEERRKIEIRSATEGFVSSCKDIGKNQWSNQPSICRVVDGVPDRVHKLRSLGNAIVPQLAYIVFQVILAIEEVEYQE